MNKDLESLLCQRYPQLFNNGVDKQPLMTWGFACDDGWFVLLDTASAMVVADTPMAFATQVKEKFGGLRFYIMGASEFGRGAIDMAETFSQVMCEKCGRPGALTNNAGWYRTLCPQHGNSMAPAETLEPKHRPGLDPNPLPLGAAWKRLVVLLFDSIGFDIEHNAMPDVRFDQIVGDGKKLNMGWTGGNDKARGMVLFTCALSARIHPDSGEVIN